MVARDILGSELNRLTALFVALCENDRRHRDYTRHMLHEALVAVVARFAVYRTYFQAESTEPNPDDVQSRQRRRSTPPKPIGPIWTPNCSTSCAKS